MRLPLNTALVDVLLAAVLAGLSVATLAGQAGPADWRAAVLGVLTVAPLALRQRAPVLTMLVIVAALVAYSLAGFGDFPNGGIGMVVAMFTVATLRSRPVAAVMFATTVVATSIAFATAASAVVWSQVAQSLLVMLGAWVLGESTRRWARRAERLAAQAARLVAAERVRIARELHDIVAHHMSVISLQAGVAEYVLDTDLPTARTAIATVGGASRDALLDLRRLLDVLRVDDVDGAQLAPQPGLAQLDDLVERVRGAGLPVEVAVAGTPRPLPPGPDLCAYRVVQESLTNVLKHAGPATARVHVEHGDRTLTVRVTDDGAGRPPQRGHRSPTAHGILGMRERAELYGGVLTAGPAAGGGFAVELRLPVEVGP
ncbi:sensor histidine kinase [Dactylosporangium aurantiacum]|uniref:sensor histidine kinase n=1 Tax=Dactylosporangium aurantiacum TaxID=35754 RepID=UPI000527554B|nr:histidine kinase [Dactylosporangium aurantiacum]MDG6103240.1 histidine kinase [Dactylosporangium aurantiacum]